MDIKTITAFIVAFTTLIGLAVTGWSKLAGIQEQIDLIASYEDRIEVIETNSAQALSEMEKRLEQALSTLESTLNDKLQTLTDQAIQTAGQIGGLESNVDKKIEDAIKKYNADTKNPLAV